MSGRYPYGIGNPPTLRRSSFPQRALRPAGGPPYQNALGATPQDPLTLKLRLDTNDAKASSVRRRRYAPKVPAAHFYVEIVDRVPIPRCGGGGRGKGQMRLRLPLERICAQYGFRFFDREKSKSVASTAKRQRGLQRGKPGSPLPCFASFCRSKRKASAASGVH